MRLSTLLASLLISFALLACDQDTPTEVTGQVESDMCSTLDSVSFSALGDDAPTITSAEAVAATNDLPAYCQVTGTIKPAVTFELRLPTHTWNGRFLMQGCGGLCGAIEMFRTDDALIRGYAVAHTDMGHEGSQVGGATWAYNNRQTEIDYAHRATHVTTVAAKALVDVYYANKTYTSYIRGCSTGGRQAMVAAQKYPGDFDGVIAGAPVNSDTSLLNIFWAAEVSTGQDGLPLFDAAALQTLTNGALASCDGNDGLEDGVITDPMQCDFDPQELLCVPQPADEPSTACLSQNQITAAKKLYQGPRKSTGEPYVSAGYMPGAETGMTFSLVGMGDYGPMFPGVMQSNIQYLAYEQDPPLTDEKFSFDFDTDPQRLAFMNKLMGGTDPDLSAFQKRGGKLLLYHGWNDESLHPSASVDYWKAVQSQMGDTSDFFRLFMIPGMAHCGSGLGADTFDVLTAMEDWVENGTAPAQLTAYKTDGKRTFEKQPRFPLSETAIQFSRPLYPYPTVSHYNGEGDPKDAESFEPVSP